MSFFSVLLFHAIMLAQEMSVIWADWDWCKPCMSEYICVCACVQNSHLEYSRKLFLFNTYMLKSFEGMDINLKKLLPVKCNSGRNCRHYYAIENNFKKYIYLNSNEIQKWKHLYNYKKQPSHFEHLNWMTSLHFHGELGWRIFLLPYCWVKL